MTAGVAETAVDPAYRLVVTGAVEQELSLTLADLAALPQTTARLPITCVEGWSAVATWTGVALVDLLAHAGATAPTEVRVVSLQEGGAYSQSILRAPHVNDPLTLLATRRQRRAAASRSRLPVPPDRTEPTRRHADEVDHSGRGGGMRRVTIIARRCARCRRDPRARRRPRPGRRCARRSPGSSAASSSTTASSCPLTLLAALAVVRFVPGTYRGLVQGALVVSATLTLALLPLLSGQGRTAANPSQQPLPYGRNLVLVLAAVWICAAVLAVRRHRREAQRPGPPPAFAISLKVRPPKDKPKPGEDGDDAAIAHSGEPPVLTTVTTLRQAH